MVGVLYRALEQAAKITDDRNQNITGGGYFGNSVFGRAWTSFGRAGPKRPAGPRHQGFGAASSRLIAKTVEREQARR